MAGDLLRAAGAGAIAQALCVAWNGRMRSTAGMACYRRRTIFLNPRLCEFGSEEVRRTLLHELAHFLAEFRAGRRKIEPHGAEWRQACGDLGIPGEPRCHSLPLPRSPKTVRYIYQCPCCGHLLRRVRKIRRSLACLACCKKYSGGKYDARFRFLPIEAEPAGQMSFKFTRV